MLSLPGGAPKVNSLESHFNSAVVKDVEGFFFADLCKGICLLLFGQWTPIAHKSLRTQWSVACSAFAKFQLAASVVSSLTLFLFIMLKYVSLRALLKTHISTTLLSYWFTFSNFFSRSSSSRVQKGVNPFPFCITILAAVRTADKVVQFNQPHSSGNFRTTLSIS
uniref:WGS project CAEQ00000000 data, annotated contig 1891 n=1 Tax=Trypanosoma congolense (strain IL3000) TaxID=1068625 RepID=F9W9S8_TRYCI|nr:unnamed protein product [Trypanosoma congolense IL3000]